MVIYRNLDENAKDKFFMGYRPWFSKWFKRPKEESKQEIMKF